MNRRINRLLPQTHTRKGKPEQSALDSLNTEDDVQEPLTSLSTVVRVKQFAKKFASSKQSRSIPIQSTSDIRSQRGRSSAPPRSSALASDSSKIVHTTVQKPPSVSTKTPAKTTAVQKETYRDDDLVSPAVSKELWVVRDQVSILKNQLEEQIRAQSLTIQTTIQEITDSVMKNIKIPAQQTIDEDKIKQEIAASVMKNIKIPAQQTIDEDKIKREIAASVIENIKIPAQQTIDEDKMKQEIAASVIENIKIPVQQTIDEDKMKQEIAASVIENIKPSNSHTSVNPDISDIIEQVSLRTKHQITSDMNIFREELAERIKHLTTTIYELSQKDADGIGNGKQSTIDRLITTEKEIRALRMKLDEFSTPRQQPGEQLRMSRSGSRSRSRPNMDTHRLSSLPVFCADLIEDLVIEGGKDVFPLICYPEWSILKDSEKSFSVSGGYYTAPFLGNYNIMLLLKTISTSVTAHISVEHQDSTGKIRRVYSIDQSALTDESTGQIMLVGVEANDRIGIMIQTRFNMKLIGREMITQESYGTEYPEIYNSLQITYYPHRGFCEFPENTRA